MKDFYIKNKGLVIFAILLIISAISYFVWEANEKAKAKKKEVDLLIAKFKADSLSWVNYLQTVEKASKGTDVTREKLELLTVDEFKALGYGYLPEWAKNWAIKVYYVSILQDERTIKEVAESIVKYQYLNDSWAKNFSIDLKKEVLS